jgi:folate-dependent phosphoribosylglycinamide formyltransferase PurN
VRSASRTTLKPEQPGVAIAVKPEKDPASLARRKKIAQRFSAGEASYVAHGEADFSPTSPQHRNIVIDIASLKRLVRRAQGGAYFRPANFRFAVGQVFDVERNLRSYSDRDHLLAATNWLKRAQDATPDGGFVGRYNLRSGWSSSYPETTGYIIPTLLRLADTLGDDAYLKRAARAIDFLLSVQLPSGAFPGAEIAENSSNPSPFNTGQIMNGLQAWAKRTGDERCRTALFRAGRWLCEVQDPSGAWLKHFYQQLATTYSAHLTCWLAEAGEFLGDEPMLEASRKHLAWCLRHFDAQRSWFNLCGFSAQDHAANRSVTHTIAYTIWGVLRTAEVVKSPEGKAAAESAAYAAMRRLELSKRLPGILDHNWKPLAKFTCLTGNVQMALIWMHMYAERGDPRLLNAALKSIDMVKAAQAMDADDPYVQGGIAGSQPVWGDYISHAFPNWAAKYFIDALLAKEKALASDVTFSNKPYPVAEPVPVNVPLSSTTPAPKQPRIALLTSTVATKVMEFHDAWSSWGFRPDLVLVERWPVPPISTRLEARIREGRLILRSVAAPSPAPPPSNTGQSHYGSVSDFCRQHSIEAIEVDSLNSPQAVNLIRDKQIDLCLYAGAGIMRKDIIGAAPLGLLNAHMGILPGYRGMNVAEWAAWNGDPVGCTVHLIDTGIDTGDILVIREVDTSGAGNIAELRKLVDAAQIELLGEVVQYILREGKLPPRRSQTAAEGLQYFRMHPALVEKLNARLTQQRSRSASS